MDVHVVGGGIAGLALAWQLRERGASPIVWEASPRAGGHVRTESAHGALVEWGPHGFLAESPGALDLVDALGLTERVVPASETAKKRFVLHRGRLEPLPSSPGTFLSTPLLSLGGKLRIFGELFVPRGGASDESIHDFATRRIGAEAANLLDAAVTGIYAGDPSFLSVNACFPKMRELEREHGSLIRGAMRSRKKAKASPSTGPKPSRRLHSFRGGMEELVTAFRRELGDIVRTDTPVRALRATGSGWELDAAGAAHTAARVALAVPATAAATLLHDLSPGVAEVLFDTRTASVGVVGFLVRRDQVGHPLDGYGFLIPGGTRPLLGCLFETSVFPERAPADHVLLRAMVGGARQAKALERPEHEWVEDAWGELNALLSISGDPRATVVFSNRDAIPQYALGHRERIEEASRELAAKLPPIVLAGASMRGVSVNHLVGEAGPVAEELLSL